MRRTLLFALGGLLLGGIIHIAVVFMIPLFANRDAWAQMKQFGRDGKFHQLPIPEAGSEPLASLDPRMIYSVCRFSLGQGPVRITASLPEDFWSVAIFDRRGRNIYSLNDRSAERSRRRKADPFRSAMSMLNFYINRAGRKLPKTQRSRLEKAKDQLRRLYHRNCTPVTRYRTVGQ